MGRRFSQLPVRALRQADESLNNLEPLVIRAQAGDRSARNEIILTFRPWIAKQARLYAKRYSGRLDLIEDLSSAALVGECKPGHGTYGLLRAIELFDPNRGAGFKTYAIYWVNAAMLAHLNANTSNTLSASKVREAAHIQDINHELTYFLGREPTYEEICKAWGMKWGGHRGIGSERIRWALDLEHAPGAPPVGDAPSDASNAPMREALVTEASAERVAELGALAGLVPKRTWAMLDMFYVQGMSAIEVGRRLKLPAKEVRAKIEAGLGKLRKAVGSGQE